MTHWTPRLDITVAHRRVTCDQCGAVLWGRFGDPAAIWIVSAWEQFYHACSKECGELLLVIVALENSK